ncbi:hypothetical protein ACLX1H_010000 [Fusarium chlamydosporum]
MTANLGNAEGITINEALANTPHTEVRDANTFIFSEGGLTADELKYHWQLAVLEKSANPKTRDGPMQMEDWRRYWTKVFYNWNSAWPEPIDVLNVSRYLPGAKVQVGVRKQDHESTQLDLNPQTRPGRRQGAPINLSVATEYSNLVLNFTWANSRDKPFGSSLVDFPSMSAALDSALVCHDQALTSAYARHNEDRIINEARRRIIYFTRKGTCQGVVLPSQFQDPELLEPELAGPRFDEMAQAFNEVAELRR